VTRREFDQMKKPIVCGRQVKIVGDVGDLYFTSLADGQAFADDVISFLAYAVGEDWVSIDVGANIGLATLALSMLAPKGSVHAFEPVPRTAAHLRANVETNGFCNVVVHEMAVGSAVTELEFFDNPEFSAGSLAMDRAAPLLRQHLTSTQPADAFIRVPCTTLDQFAQSQGVDRVDLIKIDAEGFDMEVVAGAAEVIARFRPSVIMEFASYALYMRNMLPQDALARVRSTFDRVFALEAGSGLLREIRTDIDAGDLLYENATQRHVQDLLCAFEGEGLDAILAGERSLRNHIDLTHEMAELRARIARMENSRSWRVTAPLRRLRSLLRP
jgi:FkbM family methyltransferase